MVTLVHVLLSMFALTNSILGMPTTTTTPEITELDIAFLMDTTGSMGSYINNARQNVHQVITELVQSSQADVQMALVEYRDHPPQEQTFVVRQHDFTRSIRSMESWLNAASATGGGDTPEAVADALDSATKLSWRPQATKIGVLISDAPPHGLETSDRSFANGCPNGHDPMQTIRQLAQNDVTLYAVGCEPSIVPFTDFFMALAYITGGQYLPLNNPNVLIDAIIGGAQEEISLQKFETLVQKELQKALVSAGSGSGSTNINHINETVIAQSVYQKLSQQGATSTQLLRNNQTLGEVSENAKIIAQCKSMAEVRKVFKRRPGTSIPFMGGVFSGVGTGTGAGGFSGLTGSSLGSLSGSGSGSSLGSLSGSGSGSSLGSLSGGGSGSSGGSYHPDSYSAVHSAITLDQISRLINKEVNKMPTST